MPTATLIKPRSFTIAGTNFKKGIETPVSADVARALARHPNFRVDMEAVGMSLLAVHVAGQNAMPPEEKLLAPKGPAAPAAAPADPLAAVGELVKAEPGPEAIRAAADYLSADVETNFEVDGRPAVVALSAVLGWEVTPEARDAALRLAAPSKRTAEVQPEPRRPRIVRRTKLPDPDPDLVDTGAAEIDTEEAVEA